MGVSSLPKTVTRQPRDCDLNPCPSAPESGTLTTRLPSHPSYYYSRFKSMSTRYYAIASLLHSGAKKTESVAIVILKHYQMFRKI